MAVVSLENKTLSDTYWRVQVVCMFFRNTTGIQSGPDAFDDSRFLMTFLTFFRIMEILCKFSLVLEEKILEFLEMFLANNFVPCSTRKWISSTLKLLKKHLLKVFVLVFYSCWPSNYKKALGYHKCFFEPLIFFHW